MKEFKINDNLSLIFQNSNTVIYVAGQRFMQCKFLLLNIPVNEIESLEEIHLLTSLFKIFKGKHATTNLIESKHFQVKGSGAGRKQKDDQYGHQLFTLHAFIVEHEYIHFTNLAGRPLYKYLMKDQKRKMSDIKSLKTSVISFKLF